MFGVTRDDPASHAVTATKTLSAWPLKCDTGTVYYKHTDWWTHTHTHAHRAFNHSDSRLLILLFPWPHLVKVHDSMFFGALHNPYIELSNPNCILFSEYLLVLLLSVFLNLSYNRHRLAICGQALEGSGIIFKFSSERWMRIDSPASLKLFIRSA